MKCPTLCGRMIFCATTCACHTSRHVCIAGVNWPTASAASASSDGCYPSRGIKTVMGIQPRFCRLLLFVFQLLSLSLPFRECFRKRCWGSAVPSNATLDAAVVASSIFLAFRSWCCMKRILVPSFFSKFCLSEASTF